MWRKALRFLLGATCCAIPAIAVAGTIWNYGDIRISGAGSGLIFPDGSVQSTAEIIGPIGPQGPPGPQGPAIGSLDSLHGLPCDTANPIPGTVNIAYDAAGAISIKCVYPPLLPATISYRDRVLADGGVVENIRMVDALLRDASVNGYSAEINGAVSARWGRKGSPNITKLYALGGAAYDLVQNTLDNAPCLIPGAGMSMHARTNASQISSAPYVMNQPVTIVLGGFRINKWADTAALFDGSVNYASSVFMSPPSPGIIMYTGTPSAASTANVIGQWNNAYFIFNGASSRFKIGSYPEIISAIGTNGFGGLSIGAFAGGAFNSDTQFTEIIPLTAAVDEKHGAKLAAVQSLLDKFNIAPPVPARIVCHGNSLTLGSGSTNGNTYPRQLAQVLIDSGKAATLSNHGIGGQTWAVMISTGASDVDGLYSAAVPNNIVVAWEGSNSLFYGYSATQVISDMQAYCAARRALGWKVVLLTILPRSGPGVPADFEANRQLINASIRANGPSYADALADVAADTRIGAAGAETNTNYYTDNTHLTNAGYAIIAETVKAALVPML